MANGIDSRFTNVLPTPTVVDRETSAADIIAPLAQIAMQQQARQDTLKIKYAELNQKAQQASDLKQYRSDSLDMQEKANRELNEIRSRQADTAATQAATAADKQKSDARYQEMTAFTNRIALLPPEERYKEILLNPEYMEYAGTNRKETIQKMNDHEDYKDTVMLASGLQTSNNPLRIKTMMRELQNGPMNENSRKTYQNLAQQLPKAEQYQKDLYEITPTEIVKEFPQYAEGLKSLVQKYAKTGLPDGDMTIDQVLQMGRSGAVPAGSFQKYNEEVNLLTESFANQYRVRKGIGDYSGTFPTDPTSPTLITDQAEFEITPDDYTFTDERYELLEKVQTDNPEMFEKWLNSGEEYRFKDLEADYSAGINPPPSDVMSAEQQKAIYEQGLKDNPFLTEEESFDDFPTPEVKQPEASYEPGIGWVDSQGEKATPSQIKEAKAFGKETEKSKGLTANQQRKIRTRLSRIENIQKMNYSEGEKARRIRAIQNDILSIDPNYDFKS